MPAIDPALGTLGVLVPEARNEIYSLLLHEDYKQVYKFKDKGTLKVNQQDSWGVSAFMCVNKTLQGEMLNQLSGGRHCRVCIEQNQITTDFIMHDISTNVDLPLEIGNSLIIPTCKRINITIDPTSPRDGASFHTLRQNVHAFVAIINAGSRDVNPQICIARTTSESGCNGENNEDWKRVAPVWELESASSENFYGQIMAGYVFVL